MFLQGKKVMGSLIRLKTNNGLKTINKENVLYAVFFPSTGQSENLKRQKLHIAY